MTCASVMPASETPALAKANSGRTPKATHGMQRSLELLERTLRMRPAPAPIGTASAMATPASVACTPDFSTHTQMKMPVST